jgi:hypothetical protein
MYIVKEKKTHLPNCRVLPIHDFAFLGRTGNRLKSKTTAKLKEKQTQGGFIKDEYCS